MTKAPVIMTRGGVETIPRMRDCIPELVRAMNLRALATDAARAGNVEEADRLNGKALYWIDRALWTHFFGRFAETCGYRDDRRAGSSGRPPIDVDVEMLDYALSLPAGGGRGRKGRWRLAAEKFRPTASEAELRSQVKSLRRAAAKK